MELLETNVVKALLIVYGCMGGGGVWGGGGGGGAPLSSSGLLRD